MAYKRRTFPITEVKCFVNQREIYWKDGKSYLQNQSNNYLWCNNKVINAAIQAKQHFRLLCLHITT